MEVNLMRTAVIIGAGPAGLSAAYRLLKETDIHPVILEELGQVGGISRTVEYKGNRMDIGGHRFFSKDDGVMKFWAELMPVQGSPSLDDLILKREKPLERGGPDPEKTDRVMLIRSRVSRILYLRKFFDYPVSLTFDTIKNMGFANTARAGFGYVRSAVFKRKEVSLEDFMINRFGTPLYKMFFEDYTRKVWGRSPADISADWGAQRIRGLSLSKAAVQFLKSRFSKKASIAQKNTETSLIERFLYPKRGPGQLWETLAKEITAMGGELLLNTTAVGVGTDGGRVVSVDVNSGGELRAIPCDALVSSMPVKDLVAALKTDVPEDVAEIAANLPYRDFITVGLLLRQLRLKNKTDVKTLSGIVPDCWIYIQEKDVKVGRLQIFNNWSPYLVASPQSTVWVGLEYFCDEGDSLWSMPDDRFIDFAIDEVVKTGIAERADVLDAVRLNVKKAYPAYFGTYGDFPKLREYLDTYENLYCVGRNGQHRYNNMDHSMLTGFEAAELIRTGNRSKETLWNINAEGEYHEEKQKRPGHDTP
jgi:protoporphyrinogen oxidase